MNSVDILNISPLHRPSLMNEWERCSHGFSTSFIGRNPTSFYHLFCSLFLSLFFLQRVEGWRLLGVERGKKMVPQDDFFLFLLFIYCFSFFFKSKSLFLKTIFSDCHFWFFQFANSFLLCCRLTHQGEKQQLI